MNTLYTHTRTHTQQSMQTLSMVTTSVRLDFSEIHNALILVYIIYLLTGPVFTHSLSRVLISNILSSFSLSKEMENGGEWCVCACFVGFSGIVLFKETRYGATMVCRS